MRVLTFCVLFAAGGPARAQEVISATAVEPLADKARYALWELLPLGLDDETAAVLLAMLRSQMAEIVGERLILSARAVEPSLRARIDDCDDRVECLAEASGAFGADRVVYGVVTNLGDHYNMSLKLLDVRERRVVRRETAQLSGERNQLLEQIEILLYKLIAPERLLGDLDLAIDFAGAEVLVDGERVGTTPLPESIKLGEGKHSLKVTSPVIEDYFTFFDIHYGKTTHVTVDASKIEAVQAALESAPPPVGPFGVGVKAGFSTNFGKVATPAFALELGTGLPVILRGLTFGVEISYGWSETDAAVAGGGERVETSVWSLPVLARFSYELPIEPAPYLFVAVGTAISHREISSPSSGREASDSADLATGGGAGLIWRVGPGGVTAEVSWMQTVVTGDPDNVRGNLGGLRGSVGYRLEL